MSPLQFPYSEGRPHVPIQLQHKQNKRRYYHPLLDSGADVSIFLKTHAHELGHEWDEGREFPVINADGSTAAGRIFELTMFIESSCFPAHICFIENVPGNIPVLGRADVFKHFIITINEYEQYIALQPHTHIL